MAENGSPAMRFLVTFEGSVPLTVEQVWPDGDAPENPTADDVVDVMRTYGRPTRVIEDWCLDDLRIGVRRVRPADPGEYAEHGP